MPKIQLDRIEELLLQLVNDPGPEWIPVAEVCRWLRVDRATLYRWRTSKGLAWTNINNRHVMYDKKQIQRLLYENRMPVRPVRFICVVLTKIFQNQSNAKIVPS